MSNEPFWRGIIPAIQTPLDANYEIIHETLTLHANHWADTGCSAIVALGCQRERQLLPRRMKIQILDTLVSALRARVPLVVGIDAASTESAVALARRAQQAGCSALLLSSHRETGSGQWSDVAHLSAVINATSLPCVLDIDMRQLRQHHCHEQIVALAKQCPNLQALKASACDLRLFAWLRGLLGERLELLFDLVLSPDTVPRFVRLSKLVDERRQGRKSARPTFPPPARPPYAATGLEPADDVLVACPTP